MQVPHLMHNASPTMVLRMPSRSVSLGPFGNVVRENLARRRAELGLTAQAVSDRTAAAPRPLGRSAVSELERGARRVDVDDLVTLAVALETSPSELLTSPTAGEKVDLDQGELSLLPSQVRRWLADGGDVRTVAHPDDESEAELATVNAELSKLEKADNDRDVFIGVLYEKVEKATQTRQDLEQIQTMIREETKQRQKERRRRDILELRRLELQAGIRKERP